MPCMFLRLPCFRENTFRGATNRIESCFAGQYLQKQFAAHLAVQPSASARTLLQSPAPNEPRLDPAALGDVDVMPVVEQREEHHLTNGEFAEERMR